jgi:hypothetical protein
VLKGDASLTRNGAVGRFVTVLARGSEDTCLRVTLAGRLLGHGSECAISQARDGYLWFTLWAPRTLRGRLVVSAARGTTARIDAVAVLRSPTG